MIGLLLSIYLLMMFVAGALLWACCLAGAASDARAFREDRESQVCRDCGTSSDSAICESCLEARR